ncbi:MAG: NRDE family protein [Deltaproteobacteria bacterium]|nr:NRDE family protein [Deltaproteobacteria bacterium]MDQ3299177.1 NRDE family protein [Myxococcota bacterium]
MIEIVAGAPLVIAANRDELYARPTRSPEVLRATSSPTSGQTSRIAGGLDVLSGGTWLAVRADARFAAVTNQRALATPPLGLRSRGLAVLELAAAPDPDAYVAALDPAAYASMNLAWGDATGVRIAYIRREDRTVDVVSLPPGIHVLCNDRVDADGFPRGERLAAAIERAVAVAPSWPAIAEPLSALLGDHTRVTLADTPPSHLPPELARELTATCIHSDHYGTRSASIIAAAPGRVLSYRHTDGPPCTTHFVEQRHLLEGAAI